MLQLSDRDWAEFKIGELFRITQGRKWITKSDIENNPGKTPLISCSGTNNGIMGSVDPSGINKCTVANNVLTVAVSGSAGATFYQGIEAVINSGVLILDGIEFSDKETYLFLCALVREVNSKFNYGLKASADRVGNQIIKLPITSDGTPDYQFMHDYIAEREPDYSWATQCIEPNAEVSLTDREWAEFKIGDLLTLKVAKSNDKGNLKVGTVPFVGRSNDNNGLQGFYDAPNVTRGKCITLGMVGTFRAFWQENDFAASQNILTLRAPWLNRNTALFICNIIEIDIKGRYSYGNSIKAGTFGDTILNLPVDDNGQPDYDFMERYIKSLPFSKVLKA